jgi:hypothetical protein
LSIKRKKCPFEENQCSIKLLDFLPSLFKVKSREFQKSVERVIKLGLRHLGKKKKEMYRKWRIKSGLGSNF